MVGPHHDLSQENHRETLGFEQGVQSARRVALRKYFLRVERIVGNPLKPWCIPMIIRDEAMMRVPGARSWVPAQHSADEHGHRDFPLSQTIPRTAALSHILW